MKKCFLLIVVTALVGSMPVSDAFAQRDAGAKARGEFGRGYWRPGYRRAYAGNFRAGPPTESYRAYSYEPTTLSAVEPMEFSVGDNAVVSRDAVNLMRGEDVIAAVPKGTTFTVIKVENGWLGTSTELDGKKANGWIWHRNARLQREPQAVDSANALSGTPAQQEYRSFSYQPMNSNYGTVPTVQPRTRSQHPWNYPKGDHRRYSH